MAGATRRTGEKPAPARARAGRSPDEPLRFERRIAGRARARGESVATFVDPDGRLWLTRIHLVDRSAAGLGVRAHVPVSPGATFSLALDGVPLQGVVAHSRARGGAYRLGLRCALRAAA